MDFEKREVTIKKTTTKSIGRDSISVDNHFCIVRSSILKINWFKMLLIYTELIEISGVI